MRPLPLEAFPNAPPFVAGLTVIRGAPTPVVDMRALMGEPRGRAHRFVTVRINERVVALAFDGVLGIHSLAARDVTGLPPLLKGVAGETLSAVSARDTGLLLFFEASRIFPPGLIDVLISEEHAG